mmetsp:Transcript_26990/g.43227  ORF Transcript_26990/g.43227 Transcript_26990/m.43227 type:complete len:285 (+) Transcript_26990:181-1035(+)
MTSAAAAVMQGTAAHAHYGRRPAQTVVSWRQATATSRHRVPKITRCAAVGGVQQASGLPRELLPPPTPTGAQLIASIAAKAAVPAPPPTPTNTFVGFCRSSWPLFVFAQTGALIGAGYSGISSRNKRLEIGLLNDKLRAMMEKMKDSECAFNWSVDEDEEDDWPGSKELSAAKTSLALGNVDAALDAFAAAKKVVIAYAGDNFEHMDGKAAASWLSTGKGTALALIRRGDKGSLRLAVAELKAVASIAAAEGDGSVYGLLGDVLTDLGDFTAAGNYYDKCLDMD